MKRLKNVSERTETQMLKSCLLNLAGQAIPFDFSMAAGHSVCVENLGHVGGIGGHVVVAIP